MSKEYEAKREFTRTPEPPPVQPLEGAGPLIFVVQKHSARRLHYDFRLEVDGVLKSWSVPAGPSLDPQVKRLAVMVEDHPIDYASFEGNITKGEYGAGQVIVWDYGDYSPDEKGKLSFDNRAEAQERVRNALAEGKLSITLRGHKLKGSWTLVKMKGRQNDWLLIKHRDNFASSTDILKEDASTLSSLTIEDLKAGSHPYRSSDRSEKVKLSETPGAKKAPFPQKVLPMLAGSADAPFSNPDWLFEPKLDGYRIIAAIKDGNVRLLSRRGLDVTQKYETVKDGLSLQSVKELVLDGEIVALDEKGKLCFQCLQNYLESVGRAKSHPEEVPPIIYYVFDILYLDGYDLQAVPLTDRKKILDRILVPSASMRLMEHFEGDGTAIYRGAVEQGLEGVIAKRKDSKYEAGRRSSSWLKIKSTKTDDFIICGYTQGEGNRARTFGALVLGYYDDMKQLIPVGHVGTGLNDKLLAELKKRMDAIKTKRNPFSVMPELNAPVTWVRPELVAEIKFSERTKDGRLRAPVFLRLREDKSASEVGLTKVAPTSSSKSPPKKAQLDDAINDVSEQFKNRKNEFFIEVHGNRVKLTNLDKELWHKLDRQPALTKRDLLIYLTKVSPYLLEHIHDRPLTLVRYPNGINGERFYQKHWNSPLPDFVETAPLQEHREKRQDYLMCNNLATLLWLGQVADLELHTWFARISSGPDTEVPAGLTGQAEIDFITRYPDFMIFDLDPYIYSGNETKGAEPELNRKGFAAASEAAVWLKETLDKLSLAAFVKTSGKTGLHIYVPLLRQFDFHAVQSAAKTICGFVLQRHPKEITIDWTVARRSGKVFFDYNQNARGKTLISIYSPRATPEATVSTPLRWDELGKVYPTDFTIFNIPERLSKLGDLWANILNAKSDLKGMLEGAKKS